MSHQIGVEDIEPNHWVAWSFERIGATGSGNTQEAAIADLKSKLHLLSVDVVEVLRAYPNKEKPDYLVNAFFENDKLPLTLEEIDYGLAALEISRLRLLETVEGIQAELLSKPIENERFGNINGILKHIATTEWWYCDRLGGVADWDSLPDAPMVALDMSRQNTAKFLPQLVGKSDIVSRVGEIWSPRKLLRRAVWHEKDHIKHIEQRLTQIEKGLSG